MVGTADLEKLVRQYVRRDGLQIPAYPGVAMRLTQLVGTGDFGVNDVVKIVGADPALAASLLRYANSAMYRGVAPVTTLPAAVGRIGSEGVGKLAMATSLGPSAAKRGRLQALRRRVWRSALASAACCQYLAPVRKLQVNEAFLCGLLHDFGMMVALSCIEDILDVERDDRVLPAAEWLSFAERFHVELGMMVATSWKLSELLSTVIAAHHFPERAGKHAGMVDLIGVADAVAWLMDSQAVVDNEALQSIPGLAAIDLSILGRLVPQIPPYLAGLEEAVPAPVSKTGEIKSQVVTTGSELQDHKFPAILVQGTQELPVKGCALSWEGLAFRGAAKLQENHLVRLRLGVGRDPFDVWAHVVRCVPEGGEFRSEARLFGLNGVAKDRWGRFLQSADLPIQVPATTPAA